MNKVLLFAKSKIRQFVLAEKPVLHTAWEVALPTLFAGLVTVRSTADVKALVIAVGTVFLASLKAAAKKQLLSRV